MTSDEDSYSLVGSDHSCSPKTPLLSQFQSSDQNCQQNDTKLSTKITALVSFLLLGNFIVGENINALANEDPIKATFAKQLGYHSSDALPNAYFSLGFLFPFGGLFGALSGANYNDKIGRKYLTLIFLQMVIIGNALKVLAKYTSYGICPFFIGRFFDGWGSGGLTVSAVTWMFELLSADIHKYYKPCLQIVVNLGIFLSGVIQVNKISDKRWEHYFWAPMIFSFIMSIVCIILPESPKYVYFASKNVGYTKKILMNVRGSRYKETDLQDMIKSVKKSDSVKTLSAIEIMKNRKLSPGVITAIYINLAQQITGINAILAFSSTILKDVGISNYDEAALVFLGVSLIGSLIFAPFVGSFQRKLMLLLGFGGMTISFCLNVIMINWKFPPFTQIIFLSLFVFIFQIGPGPLVWFISIEIFPPYAISAAQGVSIFANWFGNTCVFLLFPVVNNALSYNSLYIFIAFNLLTLIFLQVFAVETLDRSSEEIIKEYRTRFKILGF